MKNKILILIFKSIIVVILIALVSSCYGSYITKYHRIHPTNPNFSIAHLEKPSLDSLIISSIYEYYSFWIGDNDFNSKRREYYQLISESKLYDGTPSKVSSFIRFYKNGNISFMYRYKDSIINKNTFNPLRGELGKLRVSEDSNILITEQFTQVGQSLTYVRGKLKIKGDTIHQIEKTAGRYRHHVYVRKDIHEGYLNWEANW